MTAHDAIASGLKGSQHLFSMYLSDLSDADLLVHPVPGANHIAWQIGHLVVSEAEMLKDFRGFVYPTLPAGFAEQHGKETAFKDPPKGFSTKEQYINLFNATREATLTAVAKLSDADLDQPTTGPMATFAPTLGALLELTNNHTMMHAGQFTVVRRKLGKPVLF